MKSILLSFKSAFHYRVIGVFLLMPLLIVAPTINSISIVQARPLAATITVNTFADEYGTGSSCSLREAITAANTDAAFGGCPGGSGADVIVLGAGTYTLSIANAGGNNEDANVTGDLDINSSLTIQGAGAGSTIIQAGTTTSNGIDKVFGANPTCAAGVSVTITGVTIRNGRNTQPTSDPNFSFTGGGLDWCGGPGTGSFTLSNSIVSDNTNVNGYGGGLNIDSITPYTGAINITNVTFQNNKTQGATGGQSTGGAINIFGDQPTVTISNTQFLNNRVDNSSLLASGGAIYIRITNGGGVQIHNSIVDGNRSSGLGGGVYVNIVHPATVVNIDQGTQIINNVSGDISGGSAGGGGIFIGGNQGSTTPVTLSKVTVTGNSESSLSNSGNRQGGGGILVGLANVKVEYSRIVSNTLQSGSSGGSGLRKNTDVGAVNAINNWWGCSTGPGAAPCDTATIAGGSAGSLTTTPYLRVLTTASPSALVTNQSAVITATFRLNSAGTDVSANIDRLLGLPVTWSAVGGNLSGQQGTIQPTGNATASYQATAANVSNKVAAKVDNDGTTSGSNVASLTVNKANTTVAITSDAPDPSNTAQAVTVQFTGPTGALGNSPTAPTGVVTVTDGINVCTATLPSTSCNVTLTTPGNRTLTAQYGGDSNFNTSLSSGVPHTVIAPPSISKSFGAATLLLNGTTALTLTVTNHPSNTVALTGVGFIDNLPAGLVVATPNGLNNTCGGTTSAIAASGTISLSGGNIAVGNTCVVRVDVTGTSFGVKNNTTGSVTSANGGTGNTASASITVTDAPITGLTAVNSSPTGLGTATIFTATISGGTNVVYAWNFGDGNTSSGAVASHAYGALGTYTATVTATNSVSVVIASTVATVITQPVSGLIAMNNSPTHLGSATAFTATIMTGSSVAYTWNFGDGALGSGANASHTYAAIGVYTATVTGTNSLNSQIASTMAVVIDRAIVGLRASNDSPTRLGGTTTFTATIGDGSNVTYTWNFGDAATGSGANTTHVYGAVGSYVALVTATNGVSVVVTTTNVSIIDTPIVGLNATNDSPTWFGSPTAFTATIGSGSNVGYTWNFGDGVTGSGAHTSHTYGALGTYTATVTATNSISNVVATTAVTIVEQPLSNLVATNSSPTTIGNATQFTATVNGTTVIYAWDFGDGNAGSGANPSHTYAAIGTYTATVTATNTLGALTATTTISVSGSKVYLPLIARDYAGALSRAAIDRKVPTGRVQAVFKGRSTAVAPADLYAEVYLDPQPRSRLRFGARTRS
jgi:CSLREA domain-containing protein